MGNKSSIDYSSYENDQCIENVIDIKSTPLVVNLNEFSGMLTLNITDVPNVYQYKPMFYPVVTYKGGTNFYDGILYADGEGEIYDSKHDFHYKGKFYRGIFVTGIKYDKKSGLAGNNSYYKDSSIVMGNFNSDGLLNGKGSLWKSEDKREYQGYFHNGLPLVCSVYDTDGKLIERGPRSHNQENYNTELHGYGMRMSGDICQVGYFVNSQLVEYDFTDDDFTDDFVNTSVSNTHFNHGEEHMNYPKICEKCNLW